MSKDNSKFFEFRAAADLRFGTVLREVVARAAYSREKEGGSEDEPIVLTLDRQGVHYTITIIKEHNTGAPVERTPRSQTEADKDENIVAQHIRFGILLRELVYRIDGETEPSRPLHSLGYAISITASGNNNEELQISGEKNEKTY